MSDGSGERRSINSKIEKNKDLIHEQEINIVSLSKDVEALQVEVKNGNDRQDTAFKILEDGQEVNTKAIEGIKTAAALESDLSAGRHSEVIEAIKKISAKTEELDKRTTPPPRDSVSSLVAVATSSPLPVTGAAVHPLAPATQASLYGQLTPSQKGGAIAAGAVGAPSILWVIYQILVEVLAKM